MLHIHVFASCHIMHARRYTKLRLWNMAEEFDLLLYLDCDIIALGRIEAALDIFAPNGSAPQPLGVARDMQNEHATFNTGVLAIQPDHSFFTEMMAAGRNGSVVYDGRNSADQVFLNTWLNKRRLATKDPTPQRYSWVELPPICNLLVAMARDDAEWFDQLWPEALVLHFAGGNTQLKVHSCTIMLFQSRVVDCQSKRGCSSTEQGR